METKTCSSSTCIHDDEAQPIENFYKHSITKSGKQRYQSWCKDCMREATRLRATQRRRQEGRSQRPNAYKITNGYVESDKRRKRPGHREGFEPADDAVDSTQFSEWLRGRVRTVGLEHVALRADVDVERLRKFSRRSPEQFKRVTLTFVDKVATANGATLSLIYTEQR